MLLENQRCTELPQNGEPAAVTKCMYKVHPFFIFSDLSFSLLAESYRSR